PISGINFFFFRATSIVRYKGIEVEVRDGGVQNGLDVVGVEIIGDEDADIVTLAGGKSQEPFSVDIDNIVEDAVEGFEGVVDVFGDGLRFSTNTIEDTGVLTIVTVLAVGELCSNIVVG